MTNKVVIWGYSPNTHTHSYVHLGFAKAFSYLDYDVTWYDDDEDYSEEDVSDAIIISESNCCKYLPIVNSSKYFIHNISDDFTLEKSIEGDNIHNLLVYHEGYSWNDDIQKIDDFSWFDSKSKFEPTIKVSLCLRIKAVQASIESENAINSIIEMIMFFIFSDKCLNTCYEIIDSFCLV